MPRLLTITFTTAVFGTEAAHGGLKPPPTRRLRRAYLHLSYSMTLSRLLDTALPRRQHRNAQVLSRGPQSASAAANTLQARRPFQRRSGYAGGSQKISRH